MGEFSSSKRPRISVRCVCAWWMAFQHPLQCDCLFARTSLAHFVNCHILSQHVLFGHDLPSPNHRQDQWISSRGSHEGRVAINYANVGDCKSLMVTEIAAQSQDCFEQLTMDLGALKDVQTVRISFSNAINGWLQSSVDGVNFRNVVTVQSLNTGNLTARFLQFRFFTNPSSAYDKVYVNSFSVEGGSLTGLAAAVVCPNACSQQGTCTQLYHVWGQYCKSGPLSMRSRFHLC